MIGQNGNFGFGFTKVNGKLLFMMCAILELYLLKHNEIENWLVHDESQIRLVNMIMRQRKARGFQSLVFFGAFFGVERS